MEYADAMSSVTSLKVAVSTFPSKDSVPVFTALPAFFNVATAEPLSRAKVAAGLLLVAASK